MESIKLIDLAKELNNIAQCNRETYSTITVQISTHDGINFIQDVIAYVNGLGTVRSDSVKDIMMKVREVYSPTPKIIEDIVV